MEPSDPPVPPTNPFLENYLDRLQRDYPSAAGEETRKAFKKLYAETSAAQRVQTAADIYGHVQQLLLKDLEILKVNGLGINLMEMLIKDVTGTMKLFLSNTYDIILQNIAAAGGIEVVPQQALPTSPNSIEVTTELTDEDRILLNHPSRGQA